MVTSLSEVFDIFKDKYAEVRRLLDKSINDPPTEPYKSNYSARDLLDEMKAILINRIDHVTDEGGCPRENSMLAGIFYLHGCISMDVDEISTGEEYLLKAMDLLHEYPMHPDNIVTLLSILNQLGLLYCDRGNHKKSFEYLKQSENYYESYYKQNDEPPTEFQGLLTGTAPTVEKQSETAFEKCHTLTLYYLAQVCQWLGDTVKAAVYCHTTLRRQLDTKKFDKVDWALNAATLSQFLVEKNAFKEARHHLSAASHVLSSKQTELDASPSDEDKYKAEVEQLRHRKSDVARCWAKYCLNLMTVSRDRLMDEDVPPLKPPAELCGLEFGCLEVGEYELKVSCDYVLTFCDAKPLFLASQKWLSEAADYYSLQDHASDHVAIVKDHSQLYLQLSFFEEDESRQYKMHKRRIDMLTNLCDQLNQQFYMDLLRELWFEVAETYMTMLDLKSSQVSDSNCTQGVSKVNQIINLSHSFFRKFIDSFKDPKIDEMPSRYPDGYERSILLAQIYSARILMRKVSSDKVEHMQCNKMAYDAYEEVTSYCERWKDEFTEESHPLTKPELKACKEMVLLLLLKLQKLAQRLQ